MNALGLDISAVGNHEFDEGATELLRMQNGGCHPADGCQDWRRLHRRDFKYLVGERLQHGRANKTVLPPYEIRSSTA